MIWKFELVRIKFICDYTNALLEFETDNSDKEKFIEIVENEIKKFEINKFKFIELDSAYNEFNSIIDNCISLLKDKIELVKCSRKSDKRVQFDEDKYKDKLY